MRDPAAGTEGARAEKYSAEQAEYSRSLLGRDPEGVKRRHFEPYLRCDRRVSAVSWPTTRRFPNPPGSAPVASGERQQMK